jgi:hypothetical protein
VPENPPIPLSLILSLEKYLVRGSSYKVAHYAVFFSLLFTPNIFFSILFSAQKPESPSAPEVKYHTYETAAKS